MLRPGGARVTDRSIHTQSLQNSVAVTGDGNSVTAVFGDTGVRLPLERRQVPAPDRRRKPRPGEPPRELDIFAPGAGALPLLGREADLDALRAWLDDPADISVHALIGEAGSGKTRLALELCRLVDPPDNTGAWRAAFVRPSDLLPIADTLATRAFVWDRPTLLVLDYAASAHRALARWLDALAPDRQPHRLRFLLLEREAPEQFGWWQDLTRPGLNSGARRAELFWQDPPPRLPGLSDLTQRRDLLCAARQAALDLRPAGAASPVVPAAGDDPAFDRALAEPRFGNPLNLVMAGVIACEKPAHGALGLRRLDAAAKLADRERGRLGVMAMAEGIAEPVIHHIVAFNGLAGGLPLDDLPRVVGEELAAWGTAADARAVAGLLAQEFGRPDSPDGAGRLGTIQPDLIGETVIVRAFEGEPWLPGEAIPTVRRAYAIGQDRAAESLVRVVQDFAYALEEQDSNAAQRARGTAVLGWVTGLADGAANPIDLLPLMFALPPQTLVLREAAAHLTERLAESFKDLAAAHDDPDVLATLAGLKNNLANRLSDLGRREDALAAAEEAVRRYRALAAARPDAFTADLARCLNNLAAMLRDLGRREDALAAAAEAVRLYRALAAARPEAFTTDLAMSLNNLAAILSDLGRREDALAAADEAVRLYRALAAARPDAFTPNLAMSLDTLANVLRDLGRREEALAAAEEAVRLYRALAAARPDAFTADLAGSLNNLANRLSGLGRREDALAAAEEAVRLRRAVAAARPDAFTADLAASLNNLAGRLSDLGRREDALAAAEGAVRLFRGLADARPGAFAPHLTESLDTLANVLSGLGRREDALAAAEEAAQTRSQASLPPPVSSIARPAPTSATAGGPRTASPMPAGPKS
jgi:tetratricopeptide (TPR) repeat protein